MISANNVGGISIYGPGTSQTSCGDLIGTDVTGTNPLGNGTWGIYVDDASGNVFGGTTPATRNVISANHQGGLSIRGIASQDNVVEGNYIGTDITGTQPMGNAYSGVLSGWGVYRG